MAAFLLLLASVVGSPYLKFDTGPGPVRIERLDDSSLVTVDAEQPWVSDARGTPMLVSRHQIPTLDTTLTADR